MSAKTIQINFCDKDNPVLTICHVQIGLKHEGFRNNVLTRKLKLK